MYLQSGHLIKSSNTYNRVDNPRNVVPIVGCVADWCRWIFNAYCIETED